MRRGRLSWIGALLLAVAPVASEPVAGGPAASPGHRVLVLGIDGMDPKLLAVLMAEGRVPNLARVAAAGVFAPLATTVPPQSPVAWSSFITGAGPGTHQIFDFVHRDPAPDGAAPVVPYLSTSRVDPPARDWALSAGAWRLPLFGSTISSLRRGRPFWDELLDAGVETVVYRVPANYPPPEGARGLRCLCGMGTPDLLGTYGTFTLFSSDPLAVGRSVSGGRFVGLRRRGHHASGRLPGPENFLLHAAGDGSVPPLTVEIDVVRDPEADVARIDAGGATAVLQAGEWSDWIPVSLDTGLPGGSVLGAVGVPARVEAMVRLHLRSVHPEIELYVTPLNIDPLRPASPIATPSSFGREMARACGRYYTTGIPEDTKALRAGALDETAFLQQVELLKAERFAQYRYALDRFERGFLFFYFGHVDQLSHIFWRERDPGHPAHDPAEAGRYGRVIEDAYVEMDALVGEALDALDDGDALIVMSDHGFTSFRRGLNLNRWLVDNGFMTLATPARRGVARFFAGVDWTATRAYALGLNGLYVNLTGREKHGSVEPQQRRAVLEAIAAGLAALRDERGAPVVERVYVVDDVHPGADRLVAPDLIVGYADTYRGSWSTAEGGIPASILEDNHDRWSGDHCIAHTLVPGILVMNRPLEIDDPDLTDLAPTILREFGIEVPPAMTGRPLQETSKRGNVETSKQE